MKKDEKLSKSGDSKRMTVPESLRKTYADGLVNRAVAAEILGISKSELRRREADGIYAYVTDERGRRWFDEEALRHSVDTPMTHKPGPKKKTLTRGLESLGRLYTKEDAALVFRELEKGTSLSHVVQNLTIHPDTALAIQEAYARVVGGVFLSKDRIDRFGKLPLRGQWPPRDEKEFEVVIQASLVHSRCARCKERPARLCGTCSGSVTHADASAQPSPNGATVPR
jgi:hypothetical protein